MTLKRYLIYFSYIGTYFRGVQRQSSRRSPYNHDPSTIQGLVEYALSRMKPDNEVILQLSSRTDQGVHALRTTATVDLDFRYDVQPINIHHFCNRFFDNTDLDIKVVDVKEVPYDFISRKQALWRRYIYRFAVVKPNSIPKEKDGTFTCPIPITEQRRCYFVRNPVFDLEAVKKTTELFIGTKDFLTFRGKPNSQSQDTDTIRRIHQLYIEPASPFIRTSDDDYYNYWHLICEGKSFVYNQIRRTVSVLLAVAQNKLTIDDVESMIEEPSPDKYPSKLGVAPAHGLYLADIFYDPKDLELPHLEPQKEVYDDSNLSLEIKKKIIRERIEIMRLKRRKAAS